MGCSCRNRSNGSSGAPAETSRGARHAAPRCGWLRASHNRRCALVWIRDFREPLRTAGDRARGVLVGLVQGIAVLPGISRSGSTIVAGMRTGFSADSAFRFSFLLSLPAIFGAALLEMKDLLAVPDWQSTLPSGWGAGIAAAFFSGLAALVILRRLVARGKWRPFACYCAVLGTVSILLALWR